VDCHGERPSGLPLLPEGAAHRTRWEERQHTTDGSRAADDHDVVQDTAYVNPCYSEYKDCGVPDYLGIDNVDETWCNCDLIDVCPVSRAA
jgi:hypothetical protein